MKKLVIIFAFLLLAVGCDNTLVGQSPEVQQPVSSAAALNKINNSTNRILTTPTPETNQNNYDRTALDNCISKANNNFNSSRQAACVNVYNEDASCDVTGRGTVGAALWANYFQDTTFCLEQYPPQKTNNNFSLRATCLIQSETDFQTRKQNACINIYHEQPDCEVAGRGTVGQALYDNYNKSKQLCLGLFPS